MSSKKEAYLNFHKQCCDKMLAITKAKNADYTGTTNDPFSNFSMVEKMNITEVERGFLVRMSDKFSRVISFVNKGVLEVKDESVEDTLLDMANYCILMMGYLRQKKEDRAIGTFESVMRQRNNLTSTATLKSDTKMKESPDPNGPWDDRSDLEIQYGKAEKKIEQLQDQIYELVMEKRNIRQKDIIEELRESLDKKNPLEYELCKRDKIIECQSVNYKKQKETIKNLTRNLNDYTGRYLELKGKHTSLEKTYAKQYQRLESLLKRIDERNTQQKDIIDELKEQAII